MQLTMDSWFYLLLLAEFLIICVLVYFGSQRIEKLFQEKQKSVDTESDGAPRAVFHIFYILIIWASLAFLVPMVLGMQEQIDLANTLEARLIPVGKILLGPAILLLIIFYGIRRNYLNWIVDIDWPNEKDE